ncbi:hypothetical protein ECEC1846_2828 [Escherichia coli EC1846]|nr:hypothetical protein ECPA9_3050 [Escherichia coli PA9]EIO01342.1 hypothetical protein ECPA28_3015 [Escherichia coli PA28]EIP24175.1 hypothetical protein ECEC4422_3040 [Escherichia coli EC4422]EIP28574.1 hypothetical protein ECEC4013_3159 [Escherichia coli EC4013]EIP57862.1 hypothetical protein ECEC4448_2835 [Escherichia coli EC4448]EKH25712.1 hypothetical protein ECFDA504_2989 [Escherichia coli FDA504]EKI70554.1 hypothetical protein ECEC1846_2828 [Escherichia coli EC1846]EKJ11285.1 hypoth
MWNTHFPQRLATDAPVLADEPEVTRQHLVAGGTVMRVEQNNFRDMFSVYLSGPPQTQHVFCVSPAARVAHTGLAGEERLKAFPLQIFQDGNGGNVRIPFTAGGVPVFPKNTGYMAYQFFMCQRTVTAYLVCSITKTTG